MVAYSFHKRFADLVAAGHKRQTIRAHRKRHARPGEPVQLYTGMRTRHCRKLISPDPICLSVASVDLDIEGARFKIAGQPWYDMTEAFALADGFQNIDAMLAFWRQNHGAEMFHGVMIQWEPRRAEGGA